MIRTEGDHWHCENNDCGWSVVMNLPSREEANLRCICGSPMKRMAAPTVFSYLDFLRGEECWAVSAECMESHQV